MSIDLKQIDLLRERVNVSYEEAKEALEKNNGNLLDSIIYLEKTNKNTSTLNKEKFTESLNKYNNYKLTISKGGETILKLNLILSILIGLFTAPVSLLCLLAALILKCEFKIIAEPSPATSCNESINLSKE